MTRAGDTDKALGGVLRRAASGRLGTRADLSDPRIWKDMIVRGEGPALALAATFIGVAVAEFFTGGPTAWGLSGQALAQGRWYTFGSHMFAHAGFNHLLLNIGALMAFTPAVVGRFGRGFAGTGRYAALFGLSGLVGALTYLAWQPNGAVPMVGASGAICGLWGAAARIGDDGDLAPIRSRQVWLQTRTFAINNAILFGLVFLFVKASDGTRSLAWQAHLGGYVFGLLALPWLSPNPNTRARHTPVKAG